MALRCIYLILAVKITVNDGRKVVLICINPSFPRNEDVSNIKILQGPLPC